LDGHRLSSLYRGTDPKAKPSWFKYSQERERPGLSHGAQRHLICPHTHPTRQSREAVMKAAGLSSALLHRRH
jgi:hypothetical protein